MKALLALLTLVLSSTLFWQWRDWPPEAPGPNTSGPASAPPAQSSQPEANPYQLEPLADKEEYAVITERPLFMADRRPPSDEPEDEIPEEEEPLSDLAKLDLNAVMITPKESSAWIRDPQTREVLRLRRGEQLNGWSVQEILSDRIVLERQGEKDTLILRDYKNMPPPAPPRRQPVRRRPSRQSSPDQDDNRAAQRERRSVARRSDSFRKRLPPQFREEER